MSDTVFDFEIESKRVEEVLRRVFPTDTIDTTEGYNGRVHLKIVSRRFNGMKEPAKQDHLWHLLRDNLGENAQAISLALAYGTDEL